MFNEIENLNAGKQNIAAGSISKTFISSVFSWMSLALAITGIVAYIFGNNEEYTSLIVKPMGGFTGLGYFAIFAPIGFVLIMSFAFNKLSSTALLALFLAYSFVMGLSMSTIFLMYKAASIYLTFGIAAGTFGFMAILGYTTKTDLTKFGSIMIMGLFGIIIASVVNIFVGSSVMATLISVVGVLVFTGLTAYDVQKLKRIGSGVEYGTEATSKLAMMGALNLYLDFINLFIMLLRLFGDRKN
jgi:FtsH-binding integral membrane protein